MGENVVDAGRGAFGGGGDGFHGFAGWNVVGMGGGLALSRSWWFVSTPFIFHALVTTCVSAREIGINSSILPLSRITLI